MLLRKSDILNLLQTCVSDLDLENVSGLVSDLTQAVLIFSLIARHIMYLERERKYNMVIFHQKYNLSLTVNYRRNIKTEGRVIKSLLGMTN